MPPPHQPACPPHSISAALLRAATLPPAQKAAIATAKLMEGNEHISELSLALLRLGGGGGDAAQKSCERLVGRTDMAWDSMCSL